MRGARLIGLGMSFLAIAAWPASGQAHSVPHPYTEHETLRTNVQGAIKDSVRLLIMEHSTRIVAQVKTRRELTGPFWKDYRRAVHLPQQWSDGDGWLVNYVGHPGHGAAAGFIWTNHDQGSLASIG